MIVLASTSRYRRELLQRLRLDFEVHSPRVDEAPLENELARDLALRLARDKASNVAAQFPGAIVIGSDQTAELDGAIIGKPGEPAAAVAQLESMQGRQVVFHTAVALIDGDGQLEMVNSRKHANSGYWSYASNFSYSAAGAVTSMQLGNGRWENTIYNSRRQPTDIKLGKTPGGYEMVN